MLKAERKSDLPPFLQGFICLFFSLQSFHTVSYSTAGHPGGCAGRSQQICSHVVLLRVKAPDILCCVACKYQSFVQLKEHVRS